MKPSDNFAIAIKPGYVGLSVDKEYYSIYARRSGFNINLGSKTTAITTLATEQEVWEHVAKTAPEFLTALGASSQLYHLGMQKRAEIFLNFSESYREGLEARFEEQLLQINSVVLTELDAKIRSKKPLRPHRTSSAKGLCWWEVKSSCFVPHLGCEPHWIHVRMFPSPLDDNTWSVHVRMPAPGLNGLRENQRRIQHAVEKLAGMGIAVMDATQGCLIDL